MKKILKYFLAIAGGAMLCLFVLIFMLIKAVGSFSLNEMTTVPAKAVLHIDMAKISLAEQSMENPVAFLEGRENTNFLGIRDAVEAINIAATDPQIQYIYLKPDQVSGGLAHVEELRNALLKFRNSKPVIAYMETPGNGGYYLGSAADKIYMCSTMGAGSRLTGLSSQLFFIKDLLARLGIKVQLIRAGKYKSAGEMFIRNNISRENREQNEAMLHSIWNVWCEQIEASRGIKVQDFNALLDELKLNNASDFLRAGLVDELVNKEQMDEKLCILYGCHDKRQIEAISLENYAKIRCQPNLLAQDKIAILYADGDMLDKASLQATAPEIVGDDFARLVRDIRQDSSIKAVVLRVNSPGGSVLAADKIKVELDALKKVKPVVASYGNYAASGGYWISSGCQQIFTNHSTLTGSIGVFSMVPDLSGTLKNVLHVGSASIKTNKHADMTSTARSLDNAEIEYLQKGVNEIYDGFISLVAEGRNLGKDYVGEIAQGRVWSGVESLQRGLTDQIGDLGDALSYAASIANGDNGSDLSLWQIVSYPAAADWKTNLLNSLQMMNGEEEIFTGTPLQGCLSSLRTWKESDHTKAYARLPFEYVIH